MAFFNKKNKKSTVSPDLTSIPQPAAAVPKTDENELAAVIAAAIAAAAAVAGYTSTYNLQVRSIKRSGMHAPVWNAVSRKENLESRL